MHRSASLSRGQQLGEIAEALPQRAAALSRLFLAHSTIAVSRIETAVLAALAERPCRITELAAREGVTQPASTLLVNRLQERGWVQRRPDPNDGRAVLVELTECGEAVFAQLRAEYRALVNEEMVALSDGEVQTLARAIEILDTLIEGLGHRGS